MHLMYFTEQPMSPYPQEEGEKFGYTALLFPNKFFDPVEGSRLYHERLEEYLYAEEVGVDGIMLNEHHNAPFCMQAKVNIFAAILAAMTKRVKIVLLGNPLPVADNPVRLAEELAMIDMISKGRLVSGFVRGGGVESLAANTNPAYNRERFVEAHDLIIKTWTQPGPFRWEGNHYQFRVVNPWVLPLQQPHPRVWIPGVVSRETIVWAAEHRYPYIILNAPIEDSKKVWQLYDETAERVGYQAGSEQRGYLIRCHVAETEEKAIENAWRRPRRRRSRMRASSCGCKASSPDLPTRCGRLPQATWASGPADRWLSTGWVVASKACRLSRSSSRLCPSSLAHLSR